jgi:hypothetical protein
MSNPRPLSASVDQISPMPSVIGADQNLCGVTEQPIVLIT